jgi:4-hydroxy-tetrahydrodipicolinate synthase
MMQNKNNMKSVPQFRGMMPIMPTAITKSGQLDESSQRRLVQYCLKCGAVAVGHFGFASEFFKISDRQRTRLIEIIVDEVDGRAPVFIGVAAPANHIAVAYAQEAERLGADMIMAAIPYVTVPDPDGVYTYYRQLSDAVRLPIIVQDTALSSSILTAEFLLKMYTNIEHIDYIKAEGTNFLAKMADLLAMSGEKLPVIGGAGGKHLIHMLRAGVTAFMTGTEALDIHAAVVDAYLKGDEERAADIYFQQLLPYFMFYNDHSDELLKAMLHLRGIMDCPKVIPPGVPAGMSDIEKREFDWVLERIGFKKIWPDVP